MKNKGLEQNDRGSREYHKKKRKLEEVIPFHGILEILCNIRELKMTLAWTSKEGRRKGFLG